MTHNPSYLTDGEKAFEFSLQLEKIWIIKDNYEYLLIWALGQYGKEIPLPKIELIVEDFSISFIKGTIEFDMIEKKEFIREKLRLQLKSIIDTNLNSDLNALK